jgi:D-sedoheptulose 7-phosphate isomerase
MVHNLLNEMGVSNVITDPVDGYLTRLEDVIRAISREQVWSVVNVLMEAWRGKKHIFLLGNGGSAATASHMANDLNKFTITTGKPRFKAITLCDNVPLMTAWGNDTAYENIFVEQLLNFVEAGDVVIGISASGNSLNVLKALSVAHQLCAKTIGFTGDQGGRLKDIADYCVFIPSGHIGQQEDGHMILDHVIVTTLKQLIENEE